jgi:hypothetical protein
MHLRTARDAIESEVQDAHLCDRGENEMSNDFLVRLEELFLLDEGEFFACGGEELSFGAIEDDCVEVHVVGTPGAIRGLAQHIVEHHTASR